MLKKIIFSLLGAGLISLMLAQSSIAGFIQGTKVRTDHQISLFRGFLWSTVDYDGFDYNLTIVKSDYIIRF